MRNKSDLFEGLLDNIYDAAAGRMKLLHMEHPGIHGVPVYL
jgi:hypothetical protein